MTGRITRGLGLVGVVALAGCAVAAPLLTLEVGLTGMAPHLGQRLEARLVETSSGDEVARVVIASIASASFELKFGGLEHGASYVLDIYADFNGNGTYDAPPVDHAWRIEIPPATDPVNLGFVHNASFTDIAWPGAGGVQSVAIDGVIGASEYGHSLYDASTGIDVYWSNSATTLTMGLVSPGTGWVSAGFDPVNVMEGADLILGAVVNGTLVIEDHFGTGRFSHSIDASQDIIEAAGTESGGKTTVEFSIPLDSGDAFDVPLVPGSTHVLLLAYHGSSDDMTQKHTDRGSMQITLD